MKRTLTIVFLCTSLLLIGGCAEVDETRQVGIHPRGWAVEGSDASHAVSLASDGLPNAVQTCAECHGADYGRPDKECFGCHAVGESQGHPAEGFLERPGAQMRSHATMPPPEVATFHGQAVIDAGGTDRCSRCHAFEVAGEIDFDTGGWSQQSCSTCHAGGRSGHPAFSVWMNADSPEFHGVAAAGGMITQCSQCHGADYLGGWTGVSCNLCHPSLVGIHPNGWVGGSGTEGTHGWLIGSGEIAVDDCLACHGADYLGGWTGQGCLGCHPGFGGVAGIGTGP